MMSHDSDKKMLAKWSLQQFKEKLDYTKVYIKKLLSVYMLL